MSNKQVTTKGIEEAVLSEKDRDYLLSNSAKYLPDEPTASKMTSAQIKRQMYKASEIIFLWLQRDEANASLFAVAVDKLLDDIITGARKVGKAISDGEGNSIFGTYATKSALQSEINRATSAETALGKSISEILSGETVQDIRDFIALKESLMSADSAEAQARASADSAESSARQTADNDLQRQIDAMNAIQNVIDIVGTKAALDAYPTANVLEDDKIQVTSDESRSGATAIYRWTGSAWDFVGQMGPAYTKSEVDAKVGDVEAALDAILGV